MPSSKETRAHDAAQAPLNTAEPVRHTDINSALCAAQSQMRNAILNKINPHFKRKYADLAAIREATLPHLNVNGLALTQTSRITDTGHIIRTELRLAGSDVDVIWSERLVPFGTPQAMGSGETYARRYSWASICGITAEEDDDANAAEKASKPAPRVVGINVRSDADGVVLVNPEQRDALIALCEKFKVDKAGFCRYFDVPSIADVPEHRYEEALAKIEQSGRKRGLA